MRKRGCVMVAPHPDDETIGAGIWMSRQTEYDIRVVEITDGSPRNPHFAQAAGFASGAEYAAARRAEVISALAMIGIDSSRCSFLGLVDQQVHVCVTALVEQLVEILKEAHPEIVLSPSYEGGHPDHDSAAFAMDLAKKLLPGRFAHWEYRLYHAGADGNFDAADFLLHRETEPVVLSFSEAERQLKRRMIGVFRSQAEMTSRFPLTDEHIRIAPRYDFECPPHAGELLYEKFGWGPSWKDWRRKVISALA